MTGVSGGEPALGAVLRAAAVQLSAGGDRDRNLDTAEALVERGVRDGAQLVVLPEMFNGYGRPRTIVEGGEHLDGPTSAWAADLAARLGIWLVAGSIAEEHDGTHVWNTSCLYGPGGTLLGTYRKIHLFDNDVPGAASHESSWVRAGDEAVRVRAGTVGIGMTVCYDLRFPELYRALAAAGADVVVVPSAFMRATGDAHWEVLLRARAVENALFVVAADQWGYPVEGMHLHGTSMIVDPWGRVLARAPGDGDAVIVADLDRDAQARIRRQLPTLSHRRPDTYL